MKTENLINIYWMHQDKLKGFVTDGKLYTETNTKGLFVKIPDSNIMLHSAIHFGNVWIDKTEVDK